MCFQLTKAFVQISLQLLNLPWAGWTCVGAVLVLLGTNTPPDKAARSCSE